MTRGRIKRGSKRLKTPSNSHVVEHAVRIGESQQTRRSGKRASAAREPTPAPPPPEGGEEGASPHVTDKCPEALPPLSPDQSRAGGEEAPPKKTLGAPRDPPPPSSPAHLRGGKKKKKKKTQEAKLPKKFPRKGKSKAQKEQSLKGEKMYYTKRTLPKFPLSHRPKAQDTTCH